MVKGEVVQILGVEKKKSENTMDEAWGYLLKIPGKIIWKMKPFQLFDARDI